MRETSCVVSPNYASHNNSTRKKQKEDEIMNNNLFLRTTIGLTALVYKNNLTIDDSNAIDFVRNTNGTDLIHRIVEAITNTHPKRETKRKCETTKDSETKKPSKKARNYKNV